ncbi:MAG TPA: HAD-IIIA family hydrolase [Candidatus Cybelea sp.]|nr:HAD-IIIA family hydrolase [Candidatus Cybelea sp.]
MTKAAIFIERDGILNLPRVDGQHQITPKTLAELKLNEQAYPVMKQLKAAGFLLIATTNQPGLTDGTVSRLELYRMHDLLQHAFQLDDVLVCPHQESDGCSCRKPEPGLLTEAAFKWRVKLEHSFVVSDKWQDARAARAAGCFSMMLQSCWLGSGHSDFVVPKLKSIVDKILCLQMSPLAA